METINWQPLNEIEPGSPGVYLIEWSDGVVKYGRSDNIQQRVNKHLKLKRKVGRAEVEIQFGCKTENHKSAENVIAETMPFGNTEWLSDGVYSALQVLQATEGLEIPPGKNRPKEEPGRLISVEKEKELISIFENGRPELISIISMLGISTRNGKICFPELSHKLFGYSKKHTQQHRHNLEDKGIRFEEDIRFPANNVAEVKETPAVKPERLRDILLNINLSKSPHEKLLKTIRDNY